MYRRALDSETFLIRAAQVAPRLVCVSFAERDADGRAFSSLVSTAENCFDCLKDSLDDALAGEAELFFANAAYDLAVFCAYYPSLTSKVWEALEQGCIHDIQIREKLLNLADHGHIQEMYLPDGSAKKLSYSLSSLVMNYLGIDRSAEKTHAGIGGAGAQDTDASWRLHFRTLDGLPSSQYPDEALAYAKQDAMDTLLVSEAQEARAAELFRGTPMPEHVYELHKRSLTADCASTQETLVQIADAPPDYSPFISEPLHVGAHFALFLVTCWGLAIDQDERARIEAIVSKELTPERLKPLADAGLLRPGQPARPYANGARYPSGLPKMVPATRASVNKKKLIELVQSVCAEHNIEIKRTNETERFPDGQVKTDKDFIAQLAPLSPILEDYEHYAHLGKLQSTELPALKGIEAIYPNFEVLVETGRTSSRGGSSKGRTLYPSRNIQQIPRGFDVGGTFVEPRKCYKPRTPGWVIVANDYSQIELVALAQTAYSILGYSILRDAIIRGDDLHSFMGAQLAFSLDPDFPNLFTNFGQISRENIYKRFKALEDGSSEEQRIYEKWRPFGKVCQLALPGGMGPAKLLETARKQYRVIISSEDQAKSFKDIWQETFPELYELLGPRGWVDQNLMDARRGAGNTGSNDRDGYSYYTPLGLYRRGCTYTSARNGFALQSRTADGAKIGIFNVLRATMDPAMSSCLLGTHVLAFVHDELLLEMPDDFYLHDRAMEVSRIMRESMAQVCPDVPVKCDPIAMRVWSKKAKQVLDGQGRLKVWAPTPA